MHYSFIYERQIFIEKNVGSSRIYVGRYFFVGFSWSNGWLSWYIFRTGNIRVKNGQGQKIVLNILPIFWHIYNCLFQVTFLVVLSFFDSWKPKLCSRSAVSSLILYIPSDLIPNVYSPLKNCNTFFEIFLYSTKWKLTNTLLFNRIPQVLTNKD